MLQCRGQARQAMQLYQRFGIGGLGEKLHEGRREGADGCKEDVRFELLSVAVTYWVDCSVKLSISNTWWPYPLWSVDNMPISISCRLTLDQLFKQMNHQFIQLKKTGCVHARSPHIMQWYTTIHTNSFQWNELWLLSIKSSRFGYITGHPRQIHIRTPAPSTTFTTIKHLY